MPSEHTGHSKYPLPTTQETTLYMDQMANTEIRFQRWRTAIQIAKTRLGADYGSEHELLIAKFRLKLKKVGKTTKSLR